MKALSFRGANPIDISPLEKVNVLFWVLLLVDNNNPREFLARRFGIGGLDFDLSVRSSDPYLFSKS